MLNNIMCQKSYQAYIDGEYEKALNHIQSCLSSARRATLLNKDKNSDEFKQWVETKLFEGRILIAMQDYEEAKSVFSDINQKVIGSNISDGVRGKVQYFLSTIANELNDEEEALKRVMSAKNYFIEADMYQEAIDLCFELETYPSFAQDEDKLGNLYNEVLDLNKNISDKDQKRMNSAKTRYHAGRLLKLTDWKKAQSTFIKAQKDLNGLQMPKLEAKTMLELAQLRSYQDFSRAVEIARKALKVAFTDDIRYIANIRLATYMIWQGKLEEKGVRVSDMLNEIIKLHDKSMDTLENADDLLEIGKALFVNINDAGHLNKGLEITALAREIYDALDNKEGKVMTHFVEGLLSLRTENNNSKLQLIKVLAKNIDEVEDSSFRSPQFSLLRFLSENGLTDDELYKKIEESFDNRPQIMLAEFLQMIGMYCHANNMNQRAKYLLEKGQKMYKKVSDSSINKKQIISDIRESLDTIKV